MSERSKDGDLSISTSPGRMWWWRDEDGTYPYCYGGFGGVGRGTHTAQEVAEKIFKCTGFSMPDVINKLKELGWQDVLAPLAEHLREKKRAQIAGLKARADGLRTYAEKNADKDYQYYRKLAYEQLRRTDGTYPPDEEISVRRLHQAACAMMGSGELAERIEREIESLEKSLNDAI